LAEFQKKSERNADALTRSAGGLTRTQYLANFSSTQKIMSATAPTRSAGGLTRTHRNFKGNLRKTEVSAGQSPAVTTSADAVSL
jgi:hypothetical protein